MKKAIIITGIIILFIAVVVSINLGLLSVTASDPECFDHFEKLGDSTHSYITDYEYIEGTKCIIPQLERWKEKEKEIGHIR